MMRHVMCVLIGLVVFFGVSRVDATVYHVAGSGVDAASGSNTSPWRTLSKANSAAVAGDVVIVHGGQYADGIHPSNSGRAGSPIMFQVAPGERAVLNTRTGVHLGASSKYIVIDGFEIHASYRVVELVGSSYITIRNCTMFGGRGNYSAFSLDNVSYCVIQNNYFDRQDPVGFTRVGDNPGGGDGLRLVGGSHHNLIEGNTVIHCEHVGFASSFSKATSYQSYNVWRNNRGYDNHTNFSLQDGVQRCVFENNTSYYPGLVWTGGNGNCLQFTGSNCIIRFNTLYDDTGTVHTDRRWPALIGTGSGSANGGTPSMQYNKIYNNTVYGETDQQGWKKAGWRIDNNTSTAMYQNNNVFKNNIIAKANAAQVDDIDHVRSLASMNNRYEANLLCGAQGGRATVRYEYSGGSSVWTLDDVKRNKPNQWVSSNKEGDPMFENTIGQGPAKNFNLKAGSPAIDAAVHMTIATGSGNASTTLVVADAGYFIDGWGIPGVEGDSIKIESEAPVQIIKVDYSTNAITLNAPRNWGAGARIFYYRTDRFQGKAPDIGAHEYGNNSEISMAPAIPSLIAPADGVTGSIGLVTLLWMPVAGCSNYHVQLAIDSVFTSLVTDEIIVGATSFPAAGLRAGTVHYWRVAAISVQGTSSWSGCNRFTTGGLAAVPKDPTEVPGVFALQQNYPNPFNPSTLIRYSVASAGHVSLKVFNVLGQEVASLVDEEVPAGSHEVRFDAQALPNGAYFCRMQTATFAQTLKMLLIK